ncbi:ATP-dependent DNA helicase MPH1 isoform X1 [Neodiprion virginianus]|uniref:ATP-dependent DNA helicase MPH1 isoform X1 n=2 Tax=Neodiprion virginianus TaxID=2961670 RepID=UPI001EE703FD|nr:ATP-dependent DNA helicase MPH1 isoform X1 [Neodiprion virginianus]
MELLQRESLISSEPGTKGFDLSAGGNWIYPLNYQFREYQYTITRNALFSNTLVCLPTGLGKTLIAAVVMYNFWRWYPQGKIVFLAPTKPLVAQQISACHNIMGIPSCDTIELTGSMNPKSRKIAWLKKRVIFATPQVFQNDLDKNIAPGALVRCVVIDEAHKALGRHAYCESLRLLRTQSSCHRILALSATPGSRIEDVCQVIQNLCISNLELRDETSPDIVPYLNKRQMDIILVPLDDDLSNFKEKYISIVDRYVRLLVQYHILKGKANAISKGRIFYLYKEFKSKTVRPANYGQIMKTMNRCMSLYHAYDLMIRHGLRAFASFCETHSNDFWMTEEPDLQKLLEEILLYLGPFPNVSPLPDGSVNEIPKDVVFGHTKFQKLKDLLLDHFHKFAARREETRAIVFVEYRDSVNEVYVALLQLKPILRPKMFVGQAGQKRKQQMQAMEAFRSNEANVLISTSVGEEGLDVGEVDLIVCFDISQSSPIRLVQRMGRTGRRRDGRIVMLVTDGKEHQSLKSTIATKDSLNNKVFHSSNVVSALFAESPRMVPPEFEPECSKMHIKLQPKTPTSKGKRKREKMENDVPKENIKKAVGVKNNPVSSMQHEAEKANSSQSSMLQFLKKSSSIEDCGKVSNHVLQSSQSILPAVPVLQYDSIKLLTDDTAAVEFLTLCAIKVSKLEGTLNESNRIDETYLPSSKHDDVADFFNYPVPDLSILSCIASLEECTEYRIPEVTEDYEMDQIDNEVYVMEHNQPNLLEYVDRNSAPAAGEFNYENLFDDSSQSDETVFFDDKEIKQSDRNLKEQLQNVGMHNFENDDKVNDGEQASLQDKGDDWYADLLQDDFFDCISEDLVNTVSEDQKQECEGDNEPPSKGCFESILDESSDSEIPSSQGELDTKRNMRKSIRSSINDTIPVTQNESSIEKNTEKSVTSYLNKAVLGTRNDNHQSISESSKPSTRHLCRVDSESILKPQLLVNTRDTKESVDSNKQLHGNEKEGSCALNVTDPESRFSQSKQNEFSVSRSDIHSGSNRFNRAAGLANVKIDQSNNSNVNANPYLDEDDDVVFIEEINITAKRDESRTNSINQALNEHYNYDEDDVIIDNEVTVTEKRNANETDADTGASSITQIIQLIENSSSKGLDLSKISKNTQNMSNCCKSNSFKASKKVWPKRDLSPFEQKVPNHDLSDNNTTIASHYFNGNDNSIKNSDVVLKIEEPPEIELDLSDINWDDAFEGGEPFADNNQVSDQLNETINGAYAKADFRNRLSDRREESLLVKKEGSSENNFDSTIILSENTVDDKKSSSGTIVDFNLGDYEWDSDFETPANPVESLKQFNRLNNRSSSKKADDTIASRTASNPLLSKLGKSSAVSSSATTPKTELNTKKSEVLKSSESRKYQFDDALDSEDDFFEPHNKGKMGRDIHPKTNYVLTLNKTRTILKGSKISLQEKENIVPTNSGSELTSAFPSNSKHRNIKEKPYYIKGAVVDQNKITALHRHSLKRKKCRDRERKKSKFIDCEAEVSPGTTSGSSGEDADLDGFISYTQQDPETVDMHTHYLQSIKSVHQTGTFHFKKPRVFVPDNEVFSQAVPEDENSTYLLDSFCVSGGEDDLHAESYDESFLEVTEKILDCKKRKHSKHGRACNLKRRKVAEKLYDSNSSEDETENLRKQILDESMLYKRKQ